MHMETEDLSPVRKRVRITVPGPRVDASFSSAYAQIAKTARAPGFRRGRIPKSYLVKRYRQDAVSDVARALLNEGWQKALDDLNIVPVTEPDITADSPAQGKEFVFTVEVEVVPQIDLKPYGDLKVEKEAWTVPDDVLEQELGHLAERAAPYKEISDRDVVQTEDQIIFNYAGSIDGELFDGGSQDDAELIIGSDQFIPGFEEQLLGKTVGEDTTIEVTFPADYAAQLAGKVASFACHIKTIKARVIPEIGPDLAEAVGEDDMDAVRSKMREQIQLHHQDGGNKKARAEMRTALIAQYDFIVPPSLIEASVEDRRNDFIRKAVQDAETKVEDAKAAFEAQLDDMKATAENEVRVTLTIDAIADTESIEVDPMEVNAAIEEIIRSMGRYGSQMRQMYRDPNRRAGLRRQLRHDKTLDHLLSQADVTVVDKVVPMHDSDDDTHDHGEEGESGE